MLKPLLILHRYLAVAVGLVMALWCLSGFVMMYQPYPALGAAERQASLAPLTWTDCCQSRFLPADDAPAGDFRIEMLAGRPVLRQPGAPPFDLTSGLPVEPLLREQMLEVAADHAGRRGLDGQPRWLGEIEIDQWTVQTARRNQPVHHFALDDASGTELYINGRTGEVFQDTNRRERLLGWLGPVPHWLYPTALRGNAPLWSQIVIWAAVLGTFLTATGLYVGLSRLRRRDRGRGVTSPFRGWWYWHHMAGLVFGVLTLTWVFSGLLTMNPWGWLEGSREAQLLRQQLVGEPRTAELKQLLASIPDALDDEDFRQLRAVPFGGHLHVLALRADGGGQLLDAAGRPVAWTGPDLQAGLAQLPVATLALDLLDREDAYYYGHKRAVALPVWRAILDDAGRTRLYIDPATGDVGVVDAPSRRARWLTQGLHSLDFAGLRDRPLWDVLTLLLLTGVTVLCITGSWMALQRIRKDISPG